jgi:ABC-type phosphate/phosphonate transport system substrate-binding protein
MKRRIVWPLLLPLWAVLVSLCEMPARAADRPAGVGLRHTRLHVMASESLFGTVNQGDATASMRVWTEQIGRIHGFQFDSKVAIAHSIAQMRQGLKDHDVDLLILDTLDYLSLAESKLVEVLAAGTTRGQPGAFPYVLLTQKRTAAVQIGDLRGKRIGIASRTKSSLGLVWLETVLAENKLGRAASFFSSVDVGYRASACVLPLFFGKIDACVVDSENWEALKELNPQLGLLPALARSEPLQEGVIALPMQLHPYQRELVDSVLTLHKTAAGEQLGIVFKTGPLQRAVREQFDSVRDLCVRYKRTVDPSGVAPANAGRLEAAGKEHR